MKQPCVYLLASRHYGTLYASVTSNLLRRVSQHREGVVDGFTKKYRVIGWSGSNTTPPCPKR